ARRRSASGWPPSASTRRPARPGSTSRRASSASPRTSTGPAGGPTAPRRGARAGPASSRGPATAGPAGPAPSSRGTQRRRAAAAGDRVEVTTAGGRTFAYRVVSVRSYLKRLLPADVFSVHGRPRLVLVTCGGPFDQAAGHYRDNIVVTAVPV